MEGQLPQQRAHVHESSPLPSDQPVEIEFTGWMPVNKRFGYCGSHPQFAHTNDAPAGYTFVRRRELEVPFLKPDKPRRRLFDGLPPGIRLLKLFISPAYKIWSLLYNCV